LLIGLGVLGFTVANAWYSAAVGEWLPFFEVSTVTLAVFLLQFGWWSFRSPTQVSLYLQVALDVGLVSWLVKLTGGTESLLAFLYFPVIAAAPFLLPGAAALWTAGLSSMGCIAAVFLAAPTNPLDLAYGLSLRLLAFFLVGMIMDSYVRLYRRLEVEHATVLDQVGTGVLTADEKGVIRSLNPAAVRMLGEASGSTLETLFPGRGKQSTWEETRKKAMYVCSQAALPQGGWVVVVDDVTELYRMREKSARQERFAAVGRLAASVAHEIRNPLASLSGCLQMLAEDRENRLASLALEEAQRLNRLVEDFLQTARAPVVKPRPTDLPELLSSVVDTFSQDPRYAQTVQVQLEAETAAAVLDPDRIRQVLWNLLINAAQAMPEGGRIQVVSRPSPALEGIPDGVDLWIRDEGTGVPPEDLVRIFDPFYSSRSGGTGLGLALVDQIVGGHGGHITASRRPERGTEFHIWLPRDPSSDPILKSEDTDGR
jgi:two-component system sensor histidine kinase PilS (NtrC family)